ncbi:MAG: hypothetical protein NUV65_00165 [Candidatus Roizmanbacteria bacterium]|nr:hypothetical protein [Candidatus Roizmanbacteria bacterium]
MRKKSIILVFLLSFFVVAGAGVYAQSAQADRMGNSDTKPTQIPGRFNKFDPRLSNEKPATSSAIDGAQTQSSDTVEVRKQNTLKKLDSLSTFLTKFQTKITDNVKLDGDIRTWLTARITARQAWVDTQKNALTGVDTEDTLKPMVKTMVQNWQSYRSMGLLYTEALRFQQFSSILNRLQTYEGLLSQKNADTATLKEYIASAQNYYDEAKATLLQVNEEIIGEGYRAQSQDQLKQGYAQLRLAVKEAKQVRDALKSKLNTQKPIVTMQLSPTNEQ